MMSGGNSTRESGKKSSERIGREGASARPEYDPEEGPSNLSLNPAAMESRSDKFTNGAQRGAFPQQRMDKLTNGARYGTFPQQSMDDVNYHSPCQHQQRLFDNQTRVAPVQKYSPLSFDEEAEITAGERSPRRIKSVVRKPEISQRNTESNQSGNNNHQSEVETRRYKRGSSRHKRDRMDPGKFDGSSCIRTFFMMFSNCAKYNGWDEEDKMAHLRNALTGNAAQMLWETDDYTFEELRDRLYSRYGGTGHEEKF